MSLPGTFSATGLICPACIGNSQLSINYAGSSTQGGDSNNAIKLGGLPSSAFAQLAAGSNSFTGGMSIGGSLSANSISSSDSYQIGGTPALSFFPGLFNLYVGQSAGQGAGSGNTGTQNTATGYQTLFRNTSGSGNTAVGTSALYSNTTGNRNTAIGNFALNTNTSDSNTAVGSTALVNNTTGNNNTATGNSALFNNTTECCNTATGNNALLNNTGKANTATGDGALYNNGTGSNNVAVGRLSLSGLSTGSGNTSVGTFAGLNFNGSESNNIDINNAGLAGESGVIRIGAGTETATYIAGIFGAATSLPGAAVYVDANGHLGTVSSSRRFKEDIRDMGPDSDGLLRLRPVTFRYKTHSADGSKPIQYGLTAEEVAEVYPDLVIYGDQGQPETVQYYKLEPMLLNEVQKLAQAHADDQAEIAKLQLEVASQRKQAQEQQAAMTQLDAKVRAIEESLARSGIAEGRNLATSPAGTEGTNPRSR
jgi:hypothetical protein